MDGWNRWLYAGGDPLNYVDPTGWAREQVSSGRNWRSWLGIGALVVLGGIPVIGDVMDSLDFVRGHV